MKKISETIVFFGSGPVAASSLAMLASDFNIEAVITKPRPAHHRGSYPVLELAQELGLKTLHTTDKSQLSQLFKNASLTSRLAVVIDYGILIDQSVIDYFPLGIINSHFSLLPSWRGPDPISFAILNGDKETGVSLMLINKALDEGPLLAQRNLPISETATTPSLTEELIKLSHEMLADTLPDYVNGLVKPYPQSQANISYSAKLTKQAGQLDWQKSAAELERQIRAFIEWPRSRTTLGTHEVVITAAHVTSGQDQPGKLWRQVNQLGVHTKEGVLVIDKLIPAGKKEMTASAFLLGHKL